MKRVLFLIDNLGAGGAQRQLVGLASFLKENGYDVRVAIYHKVLFYVDDLKKHGVEYTYLEKAEKSFSRIFVLSDYIRKAKPDVVISYLDTPNVCACIAKSFNHRFRLIVSERNTTQQTGKKEKVRFNLYRFSDSIVPNSFSQADYIKRTFPFLKDKVVTIPNFVDLETFIPPIKRERREIPEIMVAASIWASKNTLGFIDAVAALRDKGYRFHISWYGLNTKWPDYIRQCKDKIGALKVGGFIELKEKTTQIRECYTNADYFCLPSFYEGTPNVICEAMSCGLPIVCSDVCDNSRYVIEGENGFLFDPRVNDSVVKAFEQLFALQDEEYLLFCERSRKLAEKKLSKDEFVKSYISLLEK